MNLLEITIQHRQEKGWPVVAEYSNSGGLPHRSDGLLAPEFHSDLIRFQINPIRYGTHLGKALFQEAVRDIFQAALYKAADEPLRILLVVEDPELKILRWERLCAPISSSGWDFLALSQQTLYSLYLPSLTDRRFPAIGRRDLRTLTLLANPPVDNRYKLAVFDAQATAASISRALGEIPCDFLGSVENAAGPASIDALCEQLTRRQHTLLHIVAHGAYSTDGETILYLFDNEGQVAPTPATMLIERLGRCGRLPHLAFLCACESGKPEAEAALGGLAQRLVRDLGLPAVVAMTDPVSIATAELLAAAFYRQLRLCGQPDQALAEAAAGLQGRADIFVPALFSRLGGRPFFSDELGDRSLTDAEIEYGLERIAALLPERAPVLADDFTSHVSTLKNTLGTDRDKLSEAVRKERDEALAAVNALSEEVLDRAFPAVALDQPLPAYNQTCPFPGLKAFQTDEQQFFFGRTQKTQELAERLRQERFLAVLGASGSGKSSLVLAGLIPALLNEEKSLQVSYMKPGSEPQAALAKQLAGQPDMLVIDQFEELFTLCRDADKRKGFLAELLQMWQEQPALRLLLTMRADFWGDCAPYSAFKDLMQEHQELLAPMTSAELRTAMEEQAKSVGLRFEADLSHRILTEVEGEPGAMPLLQHLLLELWKRRHGRWLLALEYNVLGGIKEAVGRTADAVHAELRGDKEGEALLRNIFVRLTRLDETSESGEHRDTRQRVSLRDLVPTDADPERVRALVRRLADARLLVTTGDGKTEEREVEVAHEALIRHWKRLRTWLDEDRESLILLASVRQQAADWDKNGRKDNDLPRWGERLQKAEMLFSQKRFAQNEREREFLQAAKELAEKEKQEKKERERREREALEDARKAAEKTALAQRDKAKAARIGAVVAVVLLAFAVWFGISAEEQKKIAVTQKKLAEKQTEVAKQEKLKAEDSGRKALYQLAITDLNNGLNERDSVTGNSLRALHYLAKAEEGLARNGNYNVPKNIRFSQKFVHGETIRLHSILYTEGIRGALLTSDGSRVFTWGEADSIVRTWDSNTGEPLPLLFEHNDLVQGAIFNSDESRILTWSVDNIVRLWDSSTGNLLRFFEHSKVVSGAAFNSDGSQVLTWSTDGTVRVWNSSTGNIIISLYHDEEVRGAAFNNDGKRILTWTDETARVWDANTGKPVSPPIKHQDVVWGAIINSDGTRILTWSGKDDGGECLARVWDSSTGKQLTSIMKHNDMILGALFFADEKRILIWDAEGTVKSWESNTGNLLSIVIKNDHPVQHVVFSNDESKILIWRSDGTASIWDIGTGKMLTAPMMHNKETGLGGAMFGNKGRILTWSKGDTARIWDIVSNKILLHELPQHNDWINGAMFNNDESRIVTWSVDGAVHVLDISTEKKLFPPLKHKDGVNGMIFNNNESNILTWSNDGTARVWDSNNGKELFSPLKHNDSVRGATFNNDGSRILTWSNDGTARVWDSNNGKELFPPLQHGEIVNGAIFNGDGSKILTWSGSRQNGLARIWDSRTGKSLTPWLRHKSHVNGAVFSNDESKILTWSFDGTARIWDSSTGKMLFSALQHSGNVNGARFNNDESKILTWSFDGTARVWDSSTGKMLFSILQHSGNVNGARFNNDESKILTWSQSGRACIWDSSTGNALTPMMRHEGLVGTLFNFDGSQILTRGTDGTVRLWSSYTGELLLPLMKHNSTVLGVTFSKDESKILSWSLDGTICIWDSSTGKSLVPMLQHKNVDGAKFNSDESKILTWSRDGTTRLWDISVDIDWPSEKIVLKTEVETGTEMTEAGDVQALSAATWKKKKWCEYDEIQYRLKRLTEKEWHNSQYLCEQLKTEISKRREATRQ